MASFVGSAPLSIYVSNNGASSCSSSPSSSRLSTGGKPSNLFRSFIFTRKETNRSIVCACVAPPRDVKPADADEFSSPKFNVRFPLHLVSFGFNTSNYGYRQFSILGFDPPFFISRVSFIFIELEGFSFDKLNCLAVLITLM